MDLFLVVLGVILLLAGLAGCLLPFLPGPPLSFAALLLLQFTSFAPFSEDFLIIWGLITVAVTLDDYWIPIYGAKKLNGTKAGVRGAAFGLIIGLFFFPPFGLVIGPFAGALLGELITGRSFNEALKPALVSFIGFVAGTLMKLAVSIMLTYHFLKNIWL